MRYFAWLYSNVLMMITINWRLREKCPNTEFFLDHIFLYSDWNAKIYRVNLRIQSKYRKIRTEKTPYLDTFHVVVVFE